jgi:D-alanyl-D-alanine carboxypeptidase
MFLAFAGCLAALMVSGGAQAHSRHHHDHHYLVSQAAPAPDTGFGPTASGASTILIDAQSGNVLAAAGADVPRYPASLTKLMTLDLAFQALADGRMTLDTVMPVSTHAASVEPVKLGLAPGSVISVHDAILAMTTMSANDAATVLGEFLGGGSEDRCAQMMTLRAHALGMAQTAFFNASGLPNPNQITTARDLSILARDIVVNFPQDQGFFEVQKFNFGGREVYSNNAMLKIYPGATGMKTGYTILARHNLVTSAERNGRVLIGIVLHEPSWGQTYARMTAMLDGGFGFHQSGPNVLYAQNQPPSQPAPAASGSFDTVASHHPAISGPIALAQNAPPGALAQNAPSGDLAQNAPSGDLAQNAPSGDLAQNAPSGAMAGNAPAGGFVRADWTAQLGVYSRLYKARVEAIRVHAISGMGIPRIARVERHGRTMWDAQLAGLTLSGAHETCSALAARKAACVIIAPQSDHLAMLDNSAG